MYQLPNPNNQVILGAQPADTMSSLSWHPSGDYLAGTCWDGKVMCWEINSQGENADRGFQQHQAPALDCCWDPVR